MLQVNAKPDRVVSFIDHSSGLRAAHLVESRLCVSEALQEMHMKSIREHAALLAMRKAKKDEDEQS